MEEKEIKQEEIVQDECNLDTDFIIAVADTAEVYDEEEGSVE